MNRCYKRASQRVSLIAWRISCPVGDKETRENVNEGKIKSAPDGCSLRGKRRKETKRKEKEKEKEKKKKKKKEKGENISIVLRQIQCFESATAGWRETGSSRDMNPGTWWSLAYTQDVEYVRVFWFALNDDQWRGFTIFRVVRLILRSSGATILSFAVNIVKTDAIMCCDVKWDSLDGQRRLCATTKNFYVNSSMRSFPGYRMWVNTSFQKPRFCVTMCRIVYRCIFFSSFFFFGCLKRSSWRLIGLWKSFFSFFFFFLFFLFGTTRTSIVRFNEI